MVRNNVKDPLQSTSAAATHTVLTVTAIVVVFANRLSFRRLKLHNPLVEVLICGALAVLCSTEPVAQDPYPLFLGLSDAEEHACGARHVLVMYRSPILVETLFAPPTAWHTHAAGRGALRPDVGHEAHARSPPA